MSLFLGLNLAFAILFVVIYFVFKGGNYSQKEATEKTEDALSKLSILFTATFVFGLIFITFYYS